MKGFLVSAFGGFPGRGSGSDHPDGEPAIGDVAIPPAVVATQALVKGVDPVRAFEDGRLLQIVQDLVPFPVHVPVDMMGNLPGGMTDANAGVEGAGPQPEGPPLR